MNADKLASSLAAILMAAARLAIYTVKLVNIQVMVLKDLKPEMYYRF